ncbi:MAG TPA: VWA domain-containing protein [Bryobacteraceae bacterium]|nr:VWA domain-containing protein [Bryobacteraceae bacterium]
MTLGKCLLILAGLAMPLAAQDPPPTVFRSDSRLVVLHATVLDADGRLVTNLQQGAFHVLENGVEQEVKVFRREDAPVSIGLVIDDSGSMTNKRDRVAAAALALVEASHPDDEVFVVHFNEKAYMDLDFTHDRKRLGEGLAKLDSRGTTAMRDAVRLAIEHLQRKAAEDKKVLILITDGEDNTSVIGQDYVIRAAQQSGVLIYAIGLLSEIDDQQTHRAQRDLDALTQATGGQSYYLKDASEADRTALDIAHNIRNQYTLAYSPTNQVLDGMYRRILVKASGPAPMTVLTRAGYWANGKGTVEDR